MKVILARFKNGWKRTLVGRLDRRKLPFLRLQLTFTNIPYRPPEKKHEKWSRTTLLLCVTTVQSLPGSLEVFLKPDFCLRWMDKLSWAATLSFSNSTCLLHGRNPNDKNFLFQEKFSVGAILEQLCFFSEATGSWMSQISGKKWQK